MHGLFAVQLIADVLSLYGVDVSKLADRLLLIHEQVLAETKKRRQYERYMAQFSHDMETVDEAARSSELVYQLP